MPNLTMHGCMDEGNINYRYTLMITVSWKRVGPDGRGGGAGWKRGCGLVGEGVGPGGREGVAWWKRGWGLMEERVWPGGREGGA